MTILVTGSAGFIGANFVLDWLAVGDEPVISLDKLTYAGNLANLKSLESDSRHRLRAMRWRRRGGRSTRGMVAEPRLLGDRGRE